MASPLAINIDLAAALVDNLCLFGTHGHERQGFYAQMFLSEISLNGRILPLRISGYLHDIRNLEGQIRWHHEEAKRWADDFILLVEKHEAEPGVGTALDIIHYRP